MASKVEARQKQRRGSLDFSAFRRTPKTRQRRRFSQESLASMDSCSYPQSLNNSSASLQHGLDSMPQLNLDDSKSTRSSRSSSQTGRSSVKDYGYEDVIHKSQSSPDVEEDGNLLYAPYGRSNSLSMVLFGRKSSMTGANPGASASPSPSKKISPTSVLADLFSHGASHGSSHKRDGSDAPDAKNYQKLGGMSICLDEEQGNDLHAQESESLFHSEETSDSTRALNSISGDSNSATQISTAQDDNIAFPQDEVDQQGNGSHLENQFFEDDLHREAFLNASGQMDYTEDDEDEPEASVYDESVSCFDDEEYEESSVYEEEEMRITEHSVSTADDSQNVVLETVDSNVCNVTGEEDSSSSSKNSNGSHDSNKYRDDDEPAFSLEDVSSQGEEKTTVVFDDNSDSDEASLNVAQIQDESEHSQSSNSTHSIRRRNSGSLKDFRAPASSNRADSLRDFRTIYNQREDEATESSCSMADLTMYSSSMSLRSESISSRATSLPDGSTGSVKKYEIDTENGKLLVVNASFDESQASSINSLVTSQHASSHQTSSHDSKKSLVLRNMYSNQKEEHLEPVPQVGSGDSVEEFSVSIDDASTDDSSMHLLEPHTDDDDESFACEEEVVTDEEIVVEVVDSEEGSSYYEEIIIEDDESSYEEVLIDEDISVEKEFAQNSVEAEKYVKELETIQKQTSLYSINSTSQTQRQSGSMRGELRSSSERSRDAAYQVDTKKRAKSQKQSPCTLKGDANHDDLPSIMDYIMHDSRHPRRQQEEKKVQFGNTVKRRICLFRNSDAPKKMFDIAPSLAAPSPKRNQESVESYNLLSKTGYSSFCQQTLGRKGKSKQKPEEKEWDRLQKLLRGKADDSDIEEDSASFEFGNMSPSVDESMQLLSRAHRSKCRFWFSRLYFSTTPPPSQDGRAKKLQNVTELALPQLAHWYDLPLHTIRYRSKNPHSKRSHLPNLQGSDSSLVYEMETNSYTETTKSVTSNSSWDGSRIIEMASPKPVASDSSSLALDRDHTMRGLERFFCNDLTDKIQFLHVQKVLKVQASFYSAADAEAALRKASLHSSGPSRHMAEQLGKYDTWHALRAVLTPWKKQNLGFNSSMKTSSKRKSSSKSKSSLMRKHSIQLHCK